MSVIALIQLPYDSGYREARMGRGPQGLIENGLAEELREDGFAVDVSSIRLPGGFRTEGSALVQLQRGAVLAIREVLQRGARPVLLSGNCAPAALSATAALGPKSTGVIWFDAHGDFNTPDTSASGFLDGMGLAILTGRCWPMLAQRLENFAPVPTHHVVQIGVRDVDSEEALLLDQSGITQISAKNLAQLPTVLEALMSRVGRLYVHMDVDVLDVSEGLANSYACTGGLTADEMYGAIELIREKMTIGAASITSYDPEVDRDRRIARIISRLVELLAS